ncbi:MAG: L-threo-3-hydroxyaspartate ammonia-lyase [Steroidobacteraceae bacterium]|nr:L-threo-3-hydroxyaspartate ammonia-lyase [Steroidobacteraceae bacterium]
MNEPLPDFAAVVAAAGRLQGRVRRTPVVHADAFDARAGRQVFFKCENLQTGGAFKLRGALNALLSLPDPARVARVATHSSGNHGNALAIAARSLHLPCTVVVPEGSSRTKVAAIEAAGARVVHCPAGFAAREAALATVLADKPAHVVHPFDDSDVIAGQGTAALELLAEPLALDSVVAPVGGGGLIGGTALAVRGLTEGCAVIGAEPASADDAFRSFTSGRRVDAGVPDTIADGLRGSIGVRNFELLRRHVDEVVTVSEAEIIAAMRIVLDDLKLLVEPSSAVAVAAVLGGRARRLGGQVGVILSGGNVDLGQCPFLSGGP